MTTLADKIRTPTLPVIFYELIPPSHDTDAATVQAYAECAAELVASTSVPIDAINLPEIRAERREAKRTHPYEAKTDHRHFAYQFKQEFEKPVDLVVNRCTVYEDWGTQQGWLDETKTKFEIQNVILVGGETSRIRYPGPSVTEMAQSVRYVYGDAFLCGGITIPTRRSLDTKKDEAHRLLEKARHGLEFFTSQVLYEPQSAQKLLLDYQQLCLQNDVEPRRIFLSFAPVSSRKDLEFLRWLGVEFPEEIKQTLLKVNIGIGWRSVKIAKRILADILAFVQTEKIDVPLGLNVEHITRHNFELSKEFIEELGAQYYDFTDR